jgi:hypothetical protein
MLDIVVENTNKYIDTLSVNYSDHEKYEVKRTIWEIKDCIDPLYVALILKSTVQNLDDFWGQ